MEVVFRSGNNVETYTHFKRMKNVLTVSECLSEYIRLINPRVRVTQLRLGPDPLVFYPRQGRRRPFSVAIAANLMPEKGATHALEIALLLRDRGFHLTVFGWDWRIANIDPAIADTLHDNSREALAHLFSRTEFIIDQSHLEGLGLIPIEAAFCGCIPIIGSRGAAEYIFRDGENAIVLDGYRNLKESLHRLQHLSPADKAQLSQNAMKLSDERNLELGLLDAERFFSRLK
jgi:glycosyltransferase involved in cell wall biosynthesis